MLIALKREMHVYCDKEEKRCKLKEHYNAAAAAKSLQSCPTLCNHIDSPPLLGVHIQALIGELRSHMP